MFTLFHAPGACSLAPHIALEWIGEPYEAKRVRYQSAELLAVNPAGSVPVLQRADGWTLTQAGAILHFLARRYPQAGLGGEDTLEGQAELDRWSSFLTGDLHPSFYPLFMPDRYTTATDPVALEATREAGRMLVRKRLALLDAHLAERAFILGDRRSVMDAYAFPMLRWAIAKLPEGLRDAPRVAGLHNRLAADGGVRKVLAQEGLS